jgi:hypothetical protein
MSINVAMDVLEKFSRIRESRGRGVKGYQFGRYEYPERKIEIRAISSFQGQQLKSTRKL